MGGLNIIIPKGYQSYSASYRQFVERELRTGSALWAKVEKEKKNWRKRQCAVSQRWRNAQVRGGRGRDFELKSVMDARTFFRWVNETKGAILEDPAEMDRMIKDNPELQPWK